MDLQLEEHETEVRGTALCGREAAAARRRAGGEEPVLTPGCDRPRTPGNAVATPESSAVYSGVRPRSDSD